MKTVGLVMSVDNGAVLAWLERALEHASAKRSPELKAYLEAVKEEMPFETELATGSP